MSLRIFPTDSDRVAQLKIAVTWALLATMVGGAIAEVIPDLDLGLERTYRLVAMAGFALGLHIKRSWWE